MSRKATDRFAKEDALPSDGSENDRDSADEEETRPARPGRGANPKGAAQKGEKLYCVCKRPYSETEFMICCDGCENWFHGRCVGVTESMAQSIDTYYCPDCQQNRGDEEEAEREAMPPPKEEKKVFLEPKPAIRSPASAPATPVEHKVTPTPPVQPHSVTPPSGASRHKRKNTPMRSISKMTSLLPPPALPAPEILEREAAKFKTESTYTAASVSHSLLDMMSAKPVQNSLPDKKNPSAAATQLEAAKGREPRIADAHSSDSPSYSAHPEAGPSGAAERTSPDPSEDLHPAQKRRPQPETVSEPRDEQGGLNLELVAAARSEEQGRSRAKKSARPSLKSARRDEEAASAPPAAEAKPKAPVAPATNGPAATPAPAPSPAAAPAAPTSQTPSGPAPATAPSVAQLPPPPPPAQSASASQLASPSPSPDPERKGNARYSKRKPGKKGEEDGAKPTAPEIKAELESQSEASQSQSQPAEVEPKRAKPRAKNAAAVKEAPAEPAPTAAGSATTPDETIAPRRAKLAVYFPQDYNQRPSKPSPQAGAAEAKDDKSSDGEDSKDKSPKRKPGKRKGAAQPTADAPAEGEHLAPRRAKLAAYFPEDYKGEKEEGAEGDDARSNQEDRQKYCICKRAYDNRSFMISCTRCKDWFHGTCIGIALQEAKRIKNFVCPRCEKRASTDK